MGRSSASEPSPKVIKIPIRIEAAAAALDNNNSSQSCANWPPGGQPSPQQEAASSSSSRRTAGVEAAPCRIIPILLADDRRGATVAGGQSTANKRWSETVEERGGQEAYSFGDRGAARPRSDGGQGGLRARLAAGSRTNSVEEEQPANLLGGGPTSAMAESLVKSSSTSASDIW